MPAPEKLQDIVRYKGPVSQKTVLKQAATNSELQKAIERGDSDMVAAILRFGIQKRCVNVNAPLWPTRETMLHLAARKDLRDVCVMLLEARAELSCEEITDGKSPFHEACRCGSVDVVELLLDRRVRVEDCTFTGMRAIHWAAGAGCVEVVDLLLDRKAKGDVCSGNTWEPLHHAAAGGHADTVRLLCKRGAKVDAEASGGQRPSHLACQFGHPETVVVLLDFGARGLVDELGPRGTLRGLRSSPMEELIRRVEQLRFQLDEAEELNDRGHQDEAKAAFQQVADGYEAAGMVMCAAAARADAERLPC